MTKVITKSNFGLFKIEEEYKENFKPMAWNNLSEFHIFSLRIVGDAIRPDGSIYLWTDGCYCWWTDNKQATEQRVWITENGIAMFEDCQTDELFRIEFRN